MFLHRCGNVLAPVDALELDLSSVHRLRATKEGPVSCHAECVLADRLIITHEPAPGFSLMKSSGSISGYFLSDTAKLGQIVDALRGSTGKERLSTVTQQPVTERMRSIRYKPSCFSCVSPAQESACFVLAAPCSGCMSMLRIRLPRKSGHLCASSPCLWQCSVSWLFPDEHKENWTCPALFALGNLGILRASGVAIVWTAVCHLKQYCSSQCVMVSGTSPRRWLFGMFTLKSSSPPGSMCSRSRPTLRSLKRRSQLRVSMRSRSRQTQWLLSGRSQCRSTLRYHPRSPLVSFLSLRLECGF